MRRARIASAASIFALTLLVLAPSALARAYGGEGFYGETNDKTVTYAMFIVIAAIPLTISLFSLIQWRRDKRKHARMAAAKRRAISADWRGGW